MLLGAEGAAGVAGFGSEAGGAAGGGAAGLGGAITPRMVTPIGVVSGARSRRRHGRRQALGALEPVPARVRLAVQPRRDARKGWWSVRLFNGFWFQDSKDYAQNVQTG